MFRSMLAQLLAEVPQARAAIFCDHEGESVDWAAAERPGFARLSEYDVKICGAQLAASWMLLDERARAGAAGGLRALELRAATGTLLCHAVQEGYYLMLVLTAMPGSARAARTLAEAAAAFAREM
jgi:hypothetical protein